jgi:hypothetical protein
MRDGVTTKADALHQLIAAEERSSSIFKCLGIWLKGKEYVTMDRILVPDDPENLTNTDYLEFKQSSRLKPYSRYSPKTAKSITIKQPRRLSSVVLLPLKLVNLRKTIIVTPS